MESAQVLVNGQPVYIEMETAYGDESTASGALGTLEESFDRAKQTILAVTTDMVSAVKSIDKAVTPNEFTLEFGVKFKMDGTVVVAAVGSEATINVKFVYNHKPVK